MMIQTRLPNPKTTDHQVEAIKGMVVNKKYTAQQKFSTDK